MSMDVLEGAVRYPDDLPCPQVDTDLVPRERRYISDVSEPKKYRAFQRGFQATRNNVSFIFSETQAAAFQEWYKEELLEGGGWFYADWPLLHTEKDVAHRFVTRPVWKFLARGFFHVSATLEVYERKVGKVKNIYTSKLYPIITVDTIRQENMMIGGRIPPLAAFDDGVDPVLHANQTRSPDTKRGYKLFEVYDACFLGQMGATATVTCQPKGLQSVTSG